MASEGPNYPDSGTDDASIGTLAWTNPDRIVADDTSYIATRYLNIAGQNSHYLKGLDYDFSIPAGSVITGVGLTIERYVTASGLHAQDYVVSLVIGGAVSGDSRADTVTDWPTSATAKTYGGSSDLWGCALTPDIVNAATFGAVLSVHCSATTGSTAAVDYFRMTIYYRPSVKFCGEASSKFCGVGFSKFCGEA